ncbi:MAG TPA: polysaccharide pyruvyl transferase family protein, partial [Phycisphaerales bacterium]|nr:polysaccharide pyruvyl transferase family protein [Phycisphaerales bacterium]
MTRAGAQHSGSSGRAGRRVVLLNDTSMIYHWGCTGTSTAVRQTITALGHELETVPLGAVPETSAPRTWRDFGSPAFLAGLQRRHPDVLGALERAEVVVINGEGTMHGLWWQPLVLLYLAYAARKHLGKPVQIINHSWFPQDTAALSDAGAYALYLRVYRELDFVAVRDRLSHALARACGLEPVRSFDCLPLAVARHWRRAANDRDGTGAGGSGAGPGPVVVSGSVSWGDWLAGPLEQLVRRLTAAGTPVTVLTGARTSPAPEDAALAARLRGAGAELVEAGSLDRWLDAIAAGAALVSGRFHHSIAAACVGTPFVPLASNTPKMRALREIGPEGAEIGGPETPDLPRWLERQTRAALARRPSEREVASLRARLCALAMRNFLGLGAEDPGAPWLGTTRVAHVPEEFAERLRGEVNNPDADRPLARTPDPGTPVRVDESAPLTAALAERKRILLIGNGPSALSARAGAAIDSFDGVVARFNVFHIDGFAEHVGRRTDEWITWRLFDEHRARDFERVLCVDRPPAQTWDAVKGRYPHAARLTEDVARQTRELMGYDEPSSGAYAAMWYVGQGWEVLLYGFDFFSGPRHHYGDLGEIGPKHAAGPEAQFFARLMEQGRVRRFDPSRDGPPGLFPEGPGDGREERGAALRSWVKVLETDRDRLVQEYRQQREFAQSLEADRDRVVRETVAQQAWIAELEATRDRLAEETRRQQEWIGTLEKDHARLAGEVKSQAEWVRRLEREHAELAAGLRALEKERDAQRLRQVDLEAETLRARAELGALLARQREADRSVAEAQTVRAAAELRRQEADTELERVARALAAPPGDAAMLAERARELADEVAYIKQHSTYRLGARLRRSAAFNAARWLKNRNARVASVRVLEERHPAARGGEIWLLDVRPEAGGPALPWDYLELGKGWERRAAPGRPYGQCVVASRAGARLRAPVGLAPALVFLAHPWSGKARVTLGGRTQEVDLYSPTGRAVVVGPEGVVSDGPAPVPVEHAPAAPRHPAACEVAGRRASNGHRAGAGAGADRGGGRGRPGLRLFTAREEAFIERTRAGGARVVAVSCPRWLGVTSSTRGLFEHWYPVPAEKDEDPYDIPLEVLDHHAGVIAATGTKHVVISGGDEAQLGLLERLRLKMPGARFDLFWHASYVQFGEDYTCRLLRRWVEAARAGAIYSIATDKWGQDRFFEALGVRSFVLLNRVHGPLLTAPELPDEPTEVGLWLSGPTYRKIPHTMTAALALVPAARLHGSGIDARTRELIGFFGLRTGALHEGQLGPAELEAAMRRTHLTLYVTFQECCPMLPLESLRLGVPCLTGPNSHLFEDDPYLFERLVVPFPDRAEVIADMIGRAVEERHDIVEAYRRYLMRHRHSTPFEMVEMKFHVAMPIFVAR